MCLSLADEAQRPHFRELSPTRTGQEMSYSLEALLDSWILHFLIPVRDAAARLPNGEGTRAEICELLKDSQFLAPDVTSTQVS